MSYYTDISIFCFSSIENLFSPPKLTKYQIRIFKPADSCWEKSLYFLHQQIHPVVSSTHGILNRHALFQVFDSDLCDFFSKFCFFPPKLTSIKFAYFSLQIVARKSHDPSLD